ncbi:MAG: FlgD immunoglobulin-like domain containing protein [Candidatus Latescibacterota bacterium]
MARRDKCSNGRAHRRLAALSALVAMAVPGLAQEGIWVRRADLPTPRYCPSTCVVDGVIYAIGGGTYGDLGTSGVWPTVEAYDPALDTWTPRAPLQQPRLEVATAVFGGRIYAIGGLVSGPSPSNKVEEYDPATDTWSHETEMPAPTFDIVTALVGGRIYAFGRSSCCPPVAGSSLDIYDPAARTWIRGADMPTARYDWDASVLDGKIHAIGGITGPDGVGSPVVYEYQPGRSDLLRHAARGDTAVAGRAAALPLALELTGPLSDGTYPTLQLDLSAVGGPERVALRHEGQGRYAAAPVVSPAHSGTCRLPVWIEAAALSPELLYAVSLTVVPGGDCVLYGDAAGTGWSWRGDGAATLDMAATAALHAGSYSLAVQGAGAWNLHCEPATPMSRLGYTALHLALQPGEGSPRNLKVGLNGHVGRDLLKVVDWGNQAWQTVEIPLDTLGLEPEEEIAAVHFVGMLRGALALDDVRLVALPPPPATAVVEAPSAARPAGIWLEPAYPSPFNGSTVIRYALPQAQAVDLAVFDVAGQRVATLAAGVRDAGRHAVTWDGRDDGGRLVATGVYLFRLRAGDQVQARRVLVLR